MPILLEDVFQWGIKDKPIVLVDCRVLLHCLLPAVQANPEWLKALWVVALNDPLPFLPKPKLGYTIVVVDDCRSQRYANNYWRIQFEPEYKGNRDVEIRPPEYLQLHEAISNYLNNDGSRIKLFSEDGYEADDWAGLAYNIIAESPAEFKYNPLILLTVDSDWMQLVSDKLRILFAYAKPAPLMGRLRSEYEVLRYYANKGIDIASPRSIVDVKSKQGDASDFLPPGTDAGLIDLVRPKQALPAHCKAELKKAMAGSANLNEKHFQNAQQYMAKQNCKTLLESLT